MRRSSEPSSRLIRGYANEMGLRMNRERFWFVSWTVAVALAVVLFAIAVASVNVIGMVVWGLFAVVWSVQVWFARQALHADPQ